MTSSVWEPIPPITNSGPVPTSGPTANRPTAVPYIGWEYYDTTLGWPVFAQSLTGNPIIWWNSSGQVS